MADNRRVRPGSLRWRKVTDQTHVLLEDGRPTVVRTKSRALSKELEVASDVVGMPLRFLGGMIFDGTWWVMPVGVAS